MPLNGLNFQRAEYGTESVSLDHCVFCGRGIAGEFYRTNGDLTCAVCADRIRSILPADTRAIFWRSVRLGTLAAIASSLLYLLLFRLLIDHGMGLATAFGAIGVGYVIGRAMQTAGPGARGRRYQLTASALTYASITVALMGAMFGVAGLPTWTYFLFPLGPVFLLFVGQVKLALFLLFFAGIGVRWAWMLLTPHAVKITGPETIVRPTAPTV
jgi:hypothetical protein